MTHTTSALPLVSTMTIPADGSNWKAAFAYLNLAKGPYGGNRQHGDRKTKAERHLEVSKFRVLSLSPLSLAEPFRLSHCISSRGHRPCGSLSAVSSMSDVAPVEPTVLVVVALLLAVTAQSLINSMLRGDQGLSAFLRDGDGYSGSAFQPRTKKQSRRTSRIDNNAPLSGPDPLPWLKLPKLDFVEVAGQKDEESLWISSSSPSSPDVFPQEDATDMQERSKRLQELSQQMDEAFARGNLEEAQFLKSQWEEKMKDSVNTQDDDDDDETKNL